MSTRTDATTVDRNTPAPDADVSKGSQSDASLAIDATAGVPRGDANAMKPSASSDATAASDAAAVAAIDAIADVSVVDATADGIG